MRVVRLNFQGYWRESDRVPAPSFAGIYRVHAGRFDRRKKRVSVRELLYIGDAPDLAAEIASSERKSDWARHLKRGEELCYAFAATRQGRARAHAALVYCLKPVANLDHWYSFAHEPTKLHLFGMLDGIPSVLIASDQGDPRQGLLQQFRSQLLGTK